MSIFIIILVSACCVADFGDARKVSIKFRTNCTVMPEHLKTFGLQIWMYDDDSTAAVYDPRDKMTEYYNPIVSTGLSDEIFMFGEAWDGAFAPDIEPYLNMNHHCTAYQSYVMHRCAGVYLPEWIQRVSSPQVVDMGILDLDSTSNDYCKFRPTERFAVYIIDL